MSKIITFLGHQYAAEPFVGATEDVIFVGGQSDRTMTGPQLLDLFNLVSANLGKGRVNRFSDRKAAEKRTWGILETFEAEAATEGKVELSPADKKQITEEAQARKGGSKPAAPKPADKKARKPRGMRFVFPADKEIKPVREGTFRAKLVELFSTGKGATFDEAMAATWGSKKDMDVETAKKTTYEGIRLLHYYVGYGMKQDADGRITIHK